MSEIEVLKEMIKGVQLQLKGKEKDSSKMRSRIKVLQQANQINHNTGPTHASSTTYTTQSYRGSVGASKRQKNPKEIVGA